MNGDLESAGDPIPGLQENTRRLKAAPFRWVAHLAEAPTGRTTRRRPVHQAGGPPRRTGFSRFPSEVAGDFSPRRKGTSAKADAVRPAAESILPRKKKRALQNIRTSSCSKNPNLAGLWRSAHDLVPNKEEM